MNKKAQTFGIAVLSTIFIVLIGFATINFLFDPITDLRTTLDCTNAAGISDGTKLLCLVTDIVIPYWVYLIFAIAIGAITARMYL